MEQQQLRRIRESIAKRNLGKFITRAKKFIPFWRGKKAVIKFMEDVIKNGKASRKKIQKIIDHPKNIKQINRTKKFYQHAVMIYYNAAYNMNIKLKDVSVWIEPKQNAWIWNERVYNIRRNFDVHRNEWIHPCKNCQFLLEHLTPIRTHLSM